MPKKKTVSKTGPIQERSFAADFAELEKIVESFEQDNLNVDESMKQFERGLKLAEELKKTLDSAEQKIETLKNRYTTE